MASSPARHDPWAALRHPSFRFSVAGRFATSAAMMMFAATVFWQVHEISDSAWMLAVVGIVQFIPSLSFGLVAGAVADRFDRRLLSILSQSVMCACGAILAVASLADAATLPLVFGMAFVIATAGTFDAPARQALLPALVPRGLFQNAVTIQSVVQQLGFVMGPTGAGFLIALRGPGLAYAGYASLFVVGIGCYAFMRLLPVDLPRRAISWEGIKEGVSFVRRRQVILGAMTLDMFAVIFGGAQALLPIYATKILDVGAVGYGMLAASLDVGALIASASLVLLPPVRKTGRVLLVAVAMYGVFTIIFGLSRWFPLSLLAYMLIGMSDSVSVVMRQTTIQLATPDELRGRVTSVNMLFIGASNRLGAVESGVVAALTNATFAVVSGGAGTLAVVGAVAAKMPELRRFRIDSLRERPGPQGLAGEGTSGQPTAPGAP
jgi:MFS family permease